MRLGERLGRGQDDVGVAGRLVDVDVERDHEVELLDRRLERRRVGGRDAGVAGDGDERSHLALAGSRDLLGKADDGKLAERLRAAGDAARPAPEGEALALRPAAGRVALADGGEREHRAALAVEVAGQEVEDVDEPARERAEPLRRRPDPPVDGGRVGGGELVRHPADLAGFDPAGAGDGLGRERLGERGEGVGAGRVLGERAGSGEVVGDQRVRDREQQQRIASRGDEVVLGGLLRGPRAARIDDDDLAAALADRPDPAAHVGRREQRPVRDQRVGAEDHQVVGAVDVGDRDAEPGAEHEAGGDLLRHLVDGRGRVDVLRAERLAERRPVDHRAEAVGGGVAEVDGDRVAPALGERRGEAAVDLRQRLLPARLDELAVAADERRGQPVGVLVERLQALRLRADEAVAEDVVVVAADRDDLVAAHRHGEAAGRFAERAGAVVDRLGRHVDHQRTPRPRAENDHPGGRGG